MKHTYKGFYNPKNPKKYLGDTKNIVYRSGWELRFMKYLDENPNVISWQSEEKSIPYVSPLDGKIHRYFPDFIVEIVNYKNEIKKLIVEIKPSVQTKEPKVQKRKTKKYIEEVTTWAVNKAKWDAAHKYCIDRGYEFKLLTENELFGDK